MEIQRILRLITLILVDEEHIEADIFFLNTTRFGNEAHNPSWPETTMCNISLVPAINELGTSDTMVKDMMLTWIILRI